MNDGEETTAQAEPAPASGPARDARGHFITTIDHDQRAAAAARLRADNPKMTYQQIADAVGYSNKGDAWRAVQKCREAVIKSAGAELVAAEAQQLDDLFVSALEVLERDHVVVSHGKVMLGDDGQPLIDDGPKLAAIREMRQIRESYRKLYGLDQPTQVSVSGAVRYEVVGVDPEDLT
ncbi:hypothetical protein H1V43_32180 [Streptomyces sp. PSKA54]|uniref:Terminase small subunit n=1 Tax=Streptomyces himalayensis subsp. aureolus TaxID=2758039 RepID=A0A7W2D700_9ACTN|nr:hypothetical protein [Streptomyces himalayensis]MBA4865923.1 hypothetical protein [Streptomyces himalayensis subsp. aureolus]